MSLKAELDAFRADFMAKFSPEIREALVPRSIRTVDSLRDHLE